jgi:hypothetical protein
LWALLSVPEYYLRLDAFSSMVDFSSNSDFSISSWAMLLKQPIKLSNTTRLNPPLP